MAKNIVFHIGAPRTATTVLQKYVLSELKNYFYLSKNPYGSSGLVSSKASLENEYSTGFIRSILRDEYIANEEKLNFFKFVFGLLSLKIATFPESDELAQMFGRSLLRIAKSARDFDGALVSMERFVDTSASLNGDSFHQPKSDQTFPIYQALRRAYEFGFSPRVLVILRDPLHYLRSKYCRTFFQRRSSGSRKLSAGEYIDKQCRLEAQFPGTSVLSVAMHARFVKSLAELSYVKSVGFKGLVGSIDVFRTMGIPGQNIIKFSDLPVENSLHIPGLDSASIFREIKTSLIKNKFYDKLIAEKLYD